MSAQENVPKVLRKSWERVFTESGSRGGKRRRMIEVSPRLGMLMFKSHVFRMGVRFSLRVIPIHLAEGGSGRGASSEERRQRQLSLSICFCTTAQL